jgi:hypothetical protein
LIFLTGRFVRANSFHLVPERTRAGGNRFSAAISHSERRGHREGVEINATTSVSENAL